MDELVKEEKTTMQVKKSDLSIFKDKYMSTTEKSHEAFSRVINDLKLREDSNEEQQ